MSSLHFNPARPKYKTFLLHKNKLILYMCCTSKVQIKKREEKAKKRNKMLMCHFARNMVTNPRTALHFAAVAVPLHGLCMRVPGLCALMECMCSLDSIANARTNNSIFWKYFPFVCVHIGIVRNYVWIWIFVALKCKTQLCYMTFRHYLLLV